MTTIKLNLYERYARELQRELNRSSGEVTVKGEIKFNFTSVEGRNVVKMQVTFDETNHQSINRRQNQSEIL